MRSITLLLALCAAHLALVSAHPARLNDGMQASWLAFKAQHGRNYSSELVDSMRMKIFAENKQKVELFNEHLSQSAGFSLGLNHLSDYTEAEYARLNGFKLLKKNLNTPEADKFLQEILNDQTPLPKEVDWRKVPNRVSAVKNQGQCGSCWAFAATGTLEGQQVVRRSTGSADAGKLIPVSEQNILDCVDYSQYGEDHHGCDGAIMDDALTLVSKEGGVDSEKSYPYEAEDDECRFKKSDVVMSDAGFAVLPMGDEEALKKVVANFGPVSVAIDASSMFFQLYQNGVYDDQTCGNKEENLDHGVLVVGYGTHPTQGDYWIVKNSWDRVWGDRGYILMSRNKKNQCGIATHAVIPTF